ncbi:MAG: helix-turn-helix transcriptional regulator [Clostridia bacterium]|nr:helix-turn-helix transcriptional regulator [Clostridia bacterium]
MWDWELLKNGSGKHHYSIIGQYKHEDFQYTRAISRGSREDEFCLHNHAMYELVYVLQGSVAYVAEGIRYEMEPGGLLVINPTVPHRLFICSEEPFERHILYINYTGSVSDIAAMMVKGQPVAGKGRIGSAYYPPQDADNLRHLFERMSAVSCSKNENIRGLMTYFTQALVAELSLLMMEKQPQLCSIGTSKTMDALLAFLSRNYTRDLSLQEIADAFHLSKDYCNRLFRSATGMTVMQYVIYNRILLAKQLLASGQPSIEVAKAVGYADYSSFYRAYRKVTGRPPSEDHEVPDKMLEMPFESLITQEETLL